MDRRKFNSVWMPVLAWGLTFAHPTAHAASLADLSPAEATQGLKAALEQGARTAVSVLGKTDGFLGNEKVRIPLPGYLQDAAQLLRAFGQGPRLDELLTAMNRAAEAAVPLARDMLIAAVRDMSVSDAKSVLTGGDTAVTSFFAAKTRAPLTNKFLPVVTRTTAKVGVATQYNQLAGQAAELGLVRREEASIQHYVTTKALDGLYFMIGEEERRIRRDPLSAGGALIGRVFGALK